MIYDVGDPVELTARWTVDDVPTDPDSVTCTVHAPDGTDTEPTVTFGATGQSLATFTASVIGRHVVEWVATGAVTGSEWGRFDVRDSETEQAGTAFPQGLSSWVPAV